MNIEMNYTEAAAAAFRKIGITREFEIQANYGLPTIGDLIEIEGASGRVLLKVVSRGFRSRSGAEHCQGMRLILDLHRDLTPGLEAVRTET